MCHADLDQLCALVEEFSGADGGRRATKSGTRQPSKVSRRDRTHGHPVGDISVIKLPLDAPGWSPRASIPYLWISESTSKEEVGFRPGTS